jgi:hypothetical protein
MEFSGLNDLQVFNGKVFAATSQGLFTKSLEGFGILQWSQKN